MANKKIKKIPLNRECLMEALHLRNVSIRKLGTDYNFGWTSKSVERGIKDGEVSHDLLNALGKYLDVDTDYLSGKYHLDCEKFKDESFFEILRHQLKAEKFPYLLKQHRIIHEGEFLYDRYLENVLIIHDISMRQFDILLPEKKKEFQLDLEDAIASVLIHYFSHNAKGEDTYPEVYKIKSDISNFDPDEPKNSNNMIFNYEDDSNIFEDKYAKILKVGETDHENQK